MNLLAIETSTEACSVALACGDALRLRHEIAPRRHAELLLPWIDALLAEAGLAKSALDAIAVSRGPGAFTGVRLGIATAQGIGFALDRPLLPVSTLAVLAAGSTAPVGSVVLAALDARMGEVYHGRFRALAGGRVEALGAEGLCGPDAVAVPEADWHGLGTGFAAESGRLAARSGAAAIDAAALPRADALARLGRDLYARGGAIAPAAIEPAYLRDKVAQTLAERGV